MLNSPRLDPGTLRIARRAGPTIDLHRRADLDAIQLRRHVLDGRWGRTSIGELVIAALGVGC